MGSSVTYFHRVNLVEYNQALPQFVFQGQPNIHQMVKSSSSPCVYPTNYDRPHGVAAAALHYQKRLKPSVIYISLMAR